MSRVRESQAAKMSRSITAALAAPVFALLFALQATPAEAQYIELHADGAFHSDDFWQTALAQPCDMRNNLYSYYYEDVSQISSGGGLQAQCDRTGRVFPYAPQIIQCGTQGYCFRFGTASNAAAPDQWNRSEIVFGDDVPFRHWHYVEFKFKLPNSVPDTRRPGDPESAYAPFLVQLWHQAKHSFRPSCTPDQPPVQNGIRCVQKSDILGGILLTTRPDGTRYWYLAAQGGDEDANGVMHRANEHVIERDVRREVWENVALLHYIDPASPSSVIYYSVNGEPTQVWSGKMGYNFDDNLGESEFQRVDMKMGIYSEPAPFDLKVYIDDVTLVQNIFG